MAFDELHSGSSHHHYTDYQDVEITGTTKLILIVVAVGTLILTVAVFRQIAQKEREEMEAKNR
jgi:uncharacterized membrane protein (UPF0182 family)